MYKVLRGSVGFLGVTKYVILVVGGTALIANGVVNYLFGEYVSEGLAILFCLVLLFVFRGEKSTWSLAVVSTILPMLVVVFMTIAIAVSRSEWYRVLFLYPYVMTIFTVVLFDSKPSVNHRALAIALRVLIVTSCISATYAMLQRAGYETTIALETSARATGLSRTSLNLSGILYSSVAVSVLCLPSCSGKLVATFVLVGGMLAAGGRGAIIGGLALSSAYVVLTPKKAAIRLRVAATALSLCIIVPVVYYFGFEFYRVLSAFDFASDQSNIDRLESYSSFVGQFRFWGAGVGSTSPAVGRFAAFTGFESFALNSLYELGLPLFLLIASGLLYFLWTLPRPLRRDTSSFVFGLSPMLLGQQMHNSPSVFAYSCLCLALLCLNKRATTK